MRRILGALLCLSSLFSLASLCCAADTTGQAIQSNPGAKSADLVVFAYFTDDTQETADAYFAENYTAIKDYFVGDSGRSFVNYMNTVSNGKHTVNVCFPQETARGTVSAIPLPVSQEEAKQMNVDAQVVDAVLREMPSLAQLTVDCDRDGYLDNLTIICKAESCSDASQGSTLVAHSGNSGNMGTTGGYSVCSYNILNTDRLEVTKSGLIIHEYLHTLGFPDLYRTNGDKDYPVYIWDIMASVSDSPSYPLTYLRSKIGGWLELGDITESGTYTLSAQSAASGIKGYVIQSPLRDNEVFVVEFRQRPADIYDTNSLDRMLQGSGIIVYRVDTTVQEYSNSKGYTGVWVFRPVEGMSGYSSSNGLVNIVNACLSAESGRTQIGSDNPDDGLAQGALTFSNGENSGIVISQVGSASGDEISFQVTFPDLSDADLWTNTAFPSAVGQPFEGITVAEIDGQLLAAEYDGGGFRVYLQDGNSWIGISDKLSAANYADTMRLLGYQGELYLMYTDYGNGLLVKKLNTENGAWSSVTSLATNASYFDARQVGDEMYVAYLSGDLGQTANLAAFNGSSLEYLGSCYTSSFANGAERVIDLNGEPCLFVRDASGNLLNGFLWSNGQFNKITDDSLKVNSYDAAVYNGVIYVASVNPDTSCLQFSSFDGSEWRTEVTEIDSAEATLTMLDGRLYVLASPSDGDGNFRMYSYDDGEIRQEGDTVIDSASSGFTALAVGNTLYLSYVRMADKQSIIKSKAASGSPILKGDVFPDGNLDLKDVSALYDSLISGVPVSPEDGDINQDGQVTLRDVVALFLLVHN